MMRKYIPLLLTTFLFQVFGTAQTITQTKLLLEKATALRESSSKNKLLAYSFAQQKHWDTVRSDKHGFAKLMGINAVGYPIYYTTYNNLDAAATISTNQIWQGGSGGLNLSGSSIFLKNKIGIWDGGKILDTHVELAGRIFRKDSSYFTGGGSDHATHVCGTLMAKGINPLVKGMSYGLQSIVAYDFDNDASEMSTEAANGLLISNHSYGDIAGWNKNSFTGRWEFWGRYGDNEDFKFGYYDQSAATYDDIAYNAPYYLIVKAAGNNRNVNGPAVGQPYDRFDTLGQMNDAGNRPTGISSNNSYGIIGTNGNAKNIITVGAVSPIPSGYTNQTNVVMSAFSSWGPTDDGRIKPDLVADGVNVLSTTATGTTDYLVESGTSMSAPGIAGSLLLWQEYFAQQNSTAFMRSATLKGLAIHTADEAGSFAGPDYQFGWGLLNSKKAVEVIKSAAVSKNAITSKHLIIEDQLSNGTTNSKILVAQKNGIIKATLCWTDPAGTVETVDVLNNPTPKLINDLDIRITKNGSTVYFPWILNPTVPAAAAAKGDNIRDNVEQIIIDSATKGDTYTISINHKGNLYINIPQAYSLIISQPYDSTLPLKLISFTANQSAKHQVQLTWTTSNEQNTKEFIVQHSTNGEAWNNLNTIKAKNSAQENQYQSLDANPIIGENYYRLRMIDNDGAISYSPIVKMKLASSNESLFIISPHPASTHTTLVFTKPINKASIAVYDETGKKQISFTKQLENGNSIELNTSSLMNGVYSIVLKTETGTTSQQMIIKR